jgi:predicted Zn finger-like uncharacterized protein
LTFLVPHFDLSCLKRIGGSLQGPQIGGTWYQRGVRSDSPMLIHCPTCATSYDVRPSALGVTGRSVRCVHCRTVWFANARPLEPATLAAASEQARANHPPQEAPETVAPDAKPVAIGGENNGIAAAILTESGENVASDAQVAQAELTDEAPLLDTGARALAMDGDFSSDIPSDTCPPITMADAPPIAPIDLDGSQIPTEAPTLIGFADRVDRFVARRSGNMTPAAQWPLPIPPLQAAALMLAVILVGLVWFRSSVVSAMPQMASLYKSIGLPVNLRGLTFEDVTAMQEASDGGPVISVEGKIVNVARTALEVPRLRFAMRNSAGDEVFSWTALPTRSTLGYGEQLPFRTRLASPPSDGREVVVRFYNRNDAAGGLR